MGDIIASSINLLKEEFNDVLKYFIEIEFIQVIIILVLLP